MPPQTAFYPTTFINALPDKLFTNQIKQSANVTKNSGVGKSYLTWAYLKLNVQPF
jgi:hypothetical protein